MDLAVSSRAGREATSVLDKAARVGLVCYGLMYLLLAWLAMRLALGDRDGQVSQEGALHRLAGETAGRALMWVAGFGFAALVLWQLTVAWSAYQRFDGKKRLWRIGTALGRLVVYAALGWASVRIAAGTGSGGGGTDGATSRLMSMPFGVWVVAAVGLWVVGVGVGNVVKGVTDRYEKHLDIDGRTGTIGTVLRALGRIGFTSRGLALGLVGCLFLWAAWSHDPDKSGGLDQALSRLLHTPAGPTLVGLIGVGFACFGLFAFAWARYLRE